MNKRQHKKLEKKKWNRVLKANPYLLGHDISNGTDYSCKVYGYVDSEGIRIQSIIVYK